jgi:hypothetical protein
MTAAGGIIKPKNNRACGARMELECVKEAREKGLTARKHLMSGQLDGDGDMTITAGWGDPWQGEAKWRKLMPAWFVNCLGNNRFAVFKQARGEKLVVLRYADFLDLLQ